MKGSEKVDPTFPNLPRTLLPLSTTPFLLLTWLKPFLSSSPYILHQTSIRHHLSQASMTTSSLPTPASPTAASLAVTLALSAKNLTSGSVSLLNFSNSGKILLVTR